MADGGDDRAGLLKTWLGDVRLVLSLGAMGALCGYVMWAASGAAWIGLAAGFGAPAAVVGSALYGEVRRRRG